MKELGYNGIQWVTEDSAYVIYGSVGLWKIRACNGKSRLSWEENDVQALCIRYDGLNTSIDIF